MLESRTPGAESLSCSSVEWRVEWRRAGGVAEGWWSGGGLVEWRGAGGVATPISGRAVSPKPAAAWVSFSERVVKEMLLI